MSYHALTTPDEPCSWGVCYCILIGSLVGFNIISRLVDRYLTPPSAQHSRWKWRNITVSLIHSTLSGVWTLYSYIQAPGVFDDLVHIHSMSLFHVGFFSVGYFMYDFLDVLFNNWKNSKGVLFHHVVASYCMICSYLSRVCVSYTNLGLLYEMSSITLHTRYLCKIARVPTTSQFWKSTVVTNIVTFLVFRYSVFIVMVRWIILNYARPDMPSFFTAIFLFANASGFVVNTSLFYTCLSKDFKSPHKESETSPRKLTSRSNGRHLMSTENEHFHSNGTASTNGTSIPFYRQSSTTSVAGVL